MSGGTAIFEVPNAAAANIPSIGNATYTGVAITRHSRIRGTVDGPVTEYYGPYKPANAESEGLSTGWSSLVQVGDTSLTATGGGQAGSTFTQGTLTATFNDASATLNTNNGIATETDDTSLMISDIDIVNGALKNGKDTKIKWSYWWSITRLLEVLTVTLATTGDTKSWDDLGGEAVDRDSVSVSGKFYGDTEVGLTFRAIHEGATSSQSQLDTIVEGGFIGSTTKAK